MKLNVFIEEIIKDVIFWHNQIYEIQFFVKFSYTYKIIYRMGFFLFYGIKLYLWVFVALGEERQATKLNSLFWQ